MSVLQRYLVREFGRLFGACLGLCLSGFLLADLLERLEKLVRHRVPLTAALTMVGLRLPLLVHQVVPLGLLLATVLVVCSLSRGRELLVLRGAGLSPIRALAPVLLGMSLAVCALDFLLQETALFACFQGELALRSRWMGEGKLRLTREGVWYRRGGWIFGIRAVKDRGRRLRGITICRLDEEFRLRQLWTAATASWRGGRWVCPRAEIWRLSPEGVQGHEVRPSAVLPIRERPERFRRLLADMDQMGYFQLRRVVRDLERRGYHLPAYRTRLAAKLAVPLMGLVACLLGLGVGMAVDRWAREGGLALGLAGAAALGFSFWAFQQLCLSLGMAGTLPPEVAAWMGSAVFGLGGIWFLGWASS